MTTRRGAAALGDIGIAYRILRSTYYRILPTARCPLPAAHLCCVTLVILAASSRAAAVTHRVPGIAADLSVGGFVEGFGVIDTGGGPYQPPQGTAGLAVDVAGRQWTAHVDLRGMIGGPFRDAEADVFNARHTFQNLSPSLDFPEAYIGFRDGRVELRGGIQRFAFGKLDGIPPTDVVSPRDLHDPLLRDFEDAKIGIPSLLLSYFPADWQTLDLSNLRLEAAYIPLAVPPRLPLVDERWFPPTTNLLAVVVPCSVVAPTDLPCTAPFEVPIELSTANDAAPVAFSTGGIAVRAAGTWRAIDWDLYHYSGPETAPNAILSATVTLDPSQPTMPLSADALLRQDHATIHMTGFDAAAAWGGATLRAESAFFRNRHYLRPALDLVTEVLNDPDAIRSIVADLGGQQPVAVPLGDLFVAADAIEWGVGVDYYLYGFLPLLQVNQTVLLDNAPRLLIGQPDTRLTAVVRRTWWQDRIELELRSAYTIETGSWFILPRLAYAVRDSLRLRLGYLSVGGSRNSLIGQYKRNDEVILEARWSF